MSAAIKVRLCFTKYSILCTLAILNILKQGVLIQALAAESCMCFYI